jgi:hypothetical protein
VTPGTKVRVPVPPTRELSQGEFIEFIVPEGLHVGVVVELNSPAGMIK